MIDAPLIERQIEALECAVAPRPPRWAWILVVVGLVAAIGLAAHSIGAYTTIDRLNQDAKLESGNPVVLFQDVATNGARVSPAIPSSSRSTYTRALNQYALDGAGVCLGIVLAVAGLFIRLNR
jgi:hypothetical protein